MIKDHDTHHRMEQLVTQLLSERNEQGFWEGQLSSSALGVSVSVIAFQFYHPEELSAEIHSGISWLIHHQNPDGGFGDSPESSSNISTSLLCYSAFRLTLGLFADIILPMEALSEYLMDSGLDVTSQDIAKQVLDYYHKDYTFSVPILTTCALCGIPANDAFKLIPQLPFELVLLPRSFYRFLNLSVVSYAIPALVAVGIAIFQHKESGRIIKIIRKRSIPKVLSLLEKIAPESGGFLEAIPLTAFVALSLIQSGYRNHPVVQSSIAFLKRMQRTDGSFPIDINLSNWVTSLAVKSFRNQLPEYLDTDSRQRITQHLLATQNKGIHPFNGSSPGGWGWTNHTGSVPDGDDTPGALLALLKLNPQPSEQVIHAVISGCNWLVGLQNKDGGFPTFSKGWGKLPFDQSCADLTGHALLALAVSSDEVGNSLPHQQIKRYQTTMIKAITYLQQVQQADGSWIPLWFGNQRNKNQQNPVYGTARVTAYLIDLLNCTGVPVAMKAQLNPTINGAQHYLVRVQNSDGSWGGDANLPGSIEETALAISALTSCSEAKSACERGSAWLMKQHLPLQSSPIGLYFASLWYDEKTYPLVMYIEALMSIEEKP